MVKYGDEDKPAVINHTTIATNNPIIKNPKGFIKVAFIIINNIIAPSKKYGKL